MSQKMLLFITTVVKTSNPTNIEQTPNKLNELQQPIKYNIEKETQITIHILELTVHARIIN
jgi:ferritin